MFLSIFILSMPETDHIKKAERFFIKLKQELSLMICSMIATDFLQQWELFSVGRT